MANVIAVPARIRKKLAYFSLTACGINAHTNGLTPTSRIIYQLYSGDPQQHVIDPDNMLSITRYRLIIPSTGNYKFHIQFGANISTTLQEMYVTKNYVSTDNGGSAPNNTNVDDNIIMFVNFPVNTGVNANKLPISAFAMAHCNQGDEIGWLEGGSSTTSRPEGYKFVVKQLDQEPA